MWCDNFDMDLYKVLPDAREIIAPVADVKLFTFGHAGPDGKLNHPTCWNGYPTMLAFFGFTLESIGKPEAYWTDAPVVECTFEEAMRDCWPHDYGIILRNCVVWDSLALQPFFYELMFHVRGQKVLAEGRLLDVQGRVQDSIRRAVKFFGEMWGEDELVHREGGSAER